MDYMARLEELNSKLERRGLTENEQTEIALIHSMSLLALRDEIAESLARLEASLKN